MKRQLCLLASVLLAGCATTESVWVKPASTEQEFYQDRGQCQAQAFGSSPFMNTMQIAVVFSGCMQGKGWHMEDRPIQH